MTIRFVIPGEPKGQGRPRATAIGGHARMYKAKKDALYENCVSMVGREVMAGRAPLTCPCAITIEARFPIPRSASKKQQAAMLAGEIKPRKVDADNIAKAVLDGMQKVVIDNDVDVYRLTIEKAYTGDAPCVIVEVFP